MAKSEVLSSSALIAAADVVNPFEVAACAFETVAGGGAVLVSSYRACRVCEPLGPWQESKVPSLGHFFGLLPCKITSASVLPQALSNLSKLPPPQLKPPQELSSLSMLLTPSPE